MAFSYITIICYLILFFPDADLSVESWTVKVWSFALVEKKRNTNGSMQRPASATCVEKEHDDLYFNALLRKRIATSNPHQLLSPHARRSRSWRIQVSRFHVVDQTAACMAGKLWGKSAKQKCGQNVGSASWTGVERSQVVMVLISAQESLALMWQLQSENFLYNDPWTARTILPGLNSIRSYFCNSVACIEFSFQRSIAFKMTECFQKVPPFLVHRKTVGEIWREFRCHSLDDF